MSKPNINRKTKFNNAEIIKGFRFLGTNDKSYKIQPTDLKNLMEKLGLKNKAFFTYNLVDSLCSNKEIKRKGGITKAEFTPYIEEKMNEIYSKEGIFAASSLLKDPKKNLNKNEISKKQKGLNYENISKELNIDMNKISKEMNMDVELLKYYEKRQKNKTHEKRQKNEKGRYNYSFKYRFPLNNNNSLKKEKNAKNENISNDKNEEIKK